MTRMLGVCQKFTNRTFVYIYIWYFEVQEKTVRLFQSKAHPNRQPQRKTSSESQIWCFFSAVLVSFQPSMILFRQIRKASPNEFNPKKQL